MHVLKGRTRRRAVMLTLGLASVVLAPHHVSAKPPSDPSTEVIVTGTVDLASGGIMVNGYNIAPAGAFRPSILEQGDEVIIIGTLLNDGVTIRTTSLEFFAPEE